MTGSGRRRRLGVLFGAVVLLAGIAAGVGSGTGREAERSGGRPDTTLAATGWLGSAANGIPESRVQRDVETGKGRPGSRLDEIRGPASPASPASRTWVAARAAVLERAGHPERIGQILRRGPPGASA